MANQGDDHGFISKEYISIGMSFGETKSKAMRVYAQSGQYHTIRDSPTWYQRHALNLAMLIESSSVEQIS